MSDDQLETASFEEIERLIGAIADVLGAAVASASRRSGRGRRIDECQVLCERVAYASTELEAARALLEFARRAAGAGDDQGLLYADQAAAFSGRLAARLYGDVLAGCVSYGLPDGLLEATLGSPESLARVHSFAAEARVRGIGRRAAELRGANNTWLASQDIVMVRDSVRAFANQEVAPLAQGIHTRDELVPDSLINKMADMGYFGMSAPEQYGGLGLGNLAMIVTTEELSRASLAAGGSLITRPEILTKALLKGGTEVQKRKWLPPVGKGQIMVGISVTEPDIGSDVSAVSCRAEPVEIHGRKGYHLNGAKAWCTFAGRANVLALLARTDPDPASRARGLSLFIVEKEPFLGHEFEMKQPSGGLLVGKADTTPGYRGMHSFSLSFENYFVPREDLIGEEAGLNRGFALQMSGFAAGRLQTGGRATGLAQAALETTAAYVCDRQQFGRPIVDFQLTQYQLGCMAVDLQAARQLTYKAASAMDEDETASLEPAMAKLLACDVAVRVSQQGQLLHGGWGYAEEYPISRYVVDAQVLPIFEGVKPILELKVIARQLLA